jgi:hypothetical protein
MDAALKNTNGFSTKIWGPPAWHVLRCIGFNYPVLVTDTVRAQYGGFIDHFGLVLPCGPCRANYAMNLRCAGYCPTVFDSRFTFSRFIHRLEKCVHYMTTGRVDDFPSYKHTFLQYEVFRAKCGTTTGHEHGCTGSLGYVRSKALLHIVPQHIHIHRRPFTISRQCYQDV